MCHNHFFSAAAFAVLCIFTSTCQDLNLDPYYTNTAALQEHKGGEYFPKVPILEESEDGIPLEDILSDPVILKYVQEKYGLGVTQTALPITTTLPTTTEVPLRPLRSEDLVTNPFLSSLSKKQQETYHKTSFIGIDDKGVPTITTKRPNRIHIRPHATMVPIAHRENPIITQGQTQGPINLPTPSPEYYQQNPYITNQVKVEKLPTQPPPKHENPFLATAALQRADVEPRFGEIKTENTRKDTTESVSTLSKGRIARLQEEIFKDQAKNAKYEFASDVVDEINGNDHQREEVRDGLKVVGKYSYRDGYYKRTVHYEADDKGYRVVNEEVVPLNGPTYNPNGSARVTSVVAGNKVDYTVTKDDFTGSKLLEKYNLRR